MARGGEPPLVGRGPRHCRGRGRSVATVTGTRSTARAGGGRVWPSAAEKVRVYRPLADRDSALPADLEAARDAMRDRLGSRFQMVRARLGPPPCPGPAGGAKRGSHSLVPMWGVPQPGFGSQPGSPRSNTALLPQDSKDSVGLVFLGKRK